MRHPHLKDSSRSTVSMPRIIAKLPWSPSLLPEPTVELTVGVDAQPRTTWLAPLLRVAPDGQPWLSGANGHVLRGGSCWERVGVPWGLIQGVAPQAGGSAVLLVGPDGGPWSLVAVDSRNQARWRADVPESASPGARIALLQDEQGIPYLFRPDRGGPVRRVDPAAGVLTTVANLQRYNAPVLVWEEALWRIQYADGQRQWVRRPFGGADQDVSAADPLQDTLLTAVGVRSDGGPLLTDGERLVSMSPSGATTEIPLPRATKPRVLDLVRACPRPDESVWVVAADAQGTTIYALGTD
jgi:hypothetical protein